MNTENILPTQAVTTRHASRRAVTRSILWAAPAVAVAAQTPAFAASTAWTSTVLTLQAAPALSTIPGTQGPQASIPTNTTFNTIGEVRNDGPGTANDLRVQVTFSDVAIPEGEFTVGDGWVIESEGVNEDLGRWLVTIRRVAPVAPNEVVPFVVTTRTRLAVAFPQGQSSYEVLSRSYGSDGAITSTVSDHFYVVNS